MNLKLLRKIRKNGQKFEKKTWTEVENIPIPNNYNALANSKTNVTKWVQGRRVSKFFSPELNVPCDTGSLRHKVPARKVPDYCDIRSLAL